MRDVNGIDKQTAVLPATSAVSELRDELKAKTLKAANLVMAQYGVLNTKPDPNLVNEVAAKLKSRGGDLAPESAAVNNLRLKLQQGS